MHSYPREFVKFLLDRWESFPCITSELALLTFAGSAALPAPDILENLISTCYQASLLREETRPIRFRLILCDPDCFAPEGGPPTGMHRLVFTEARPFNERELRRLSPAADFYRSLIGIRLDQDRGLLIWGIVHTGPDWIQAFYGGRKLFQPLPASLVIGVTSPGRIAVGNGSIIVATLNGGEISCQSLDVFDSQWLPATFAGIRSELWELHSAARLPYWARLDPDFVRIIGQHVVRRIISTIRNYHHGGTLIFLPEYRTAEFIAGNPYLSVKYQFMEEQPRHRFRTLMLELMNTLAATYGQNGYQGRIVGWKEFTEDRNEALSQLDEAIFEMANLISVLSAVDGAVVLTNRLEMLGFGAVILGDIDQVQVVARALDAEGENVELEKTEGFGTRHRSAYLFSNQLTDALVIVISQDGNVQFIKWKDEVVTYWDQVAAGMLDF
jgi:hypothetical protein